MNSDIRSTRLTATGTVFAGPARVKAIAVLDGATAGTLTIRDGGASGEIKTVLDTPGAAAGTQWFEIPGNGLRCETDVHATFDQAVGVTVFYA